MTKPSSFYPVFLASGESLSTSASTSFFRVLGLGSIQKLCGLLKAVAVVRTLCAVASMTFVVMPSHAALVVGAQAPDFSLHDQYGNTVSLSDFAGTGVILDLSAMWCPPSQSFSQAMGLGQMGDVLNGLNLVQTVLVDGLSYWTPTTQADAQSWANTYGLSSSILHMDGVWSPTEYDMVTNYMQGVDPNNPTAVAFPTFVFIDANLNVVGANQGDPVFWYQGSWQSSNSGLYPGVSDVDVWNGFVAQIESTQPVPEPETYALMLCGLGLVGFIARRHKNQVA